MINPVLVLECDATRISVRKLELRHEHMVVGGGRRLYRVAHWPQVPTVENMVEYVGVPAPGGLLRLHRAITEWRKLPHQRVVPAEVEIAPDQRRAVRSAQLLHHELELAEVFLAARTEHEKRQQVRVEDLKLAAKQRGLCADQQAVGGRSFFSFEFKFNLWRRQ